VFLNAGLEGMLLAGLRQLLVQILEEEQLEEIP